MSQIEFLKDYIEKRTKLYNAYTQAGNNIAAKQADIDIVNALTLLRDLKYSLKKEIYGKHD